MSSSAALWPRDRRCAATRQSGLSKTGSLVSVKVVRTSTITYVILLMLFSQDDFYHLRKCHGMTVYYTIYIGSYDNIDGLKQK